MRALSHSALPRASQLDEPILHVLKTSPDTLDNDAIDQAVARQLGVPEQALRALHTPGHGTRTEFAYRMAWARTRLRLKGLIERVGSRSWRAVRQSL
ncbi:MAG: hypothetical protein EOO73_29355 [Myxococcales bacterium]|nr:MAG: hypothetical protein EOO73_29355 [Myxococcales bacterium]